MPSFWMWAHFKKKRKCRGNKKRYLEVYFYSRKQLYGQEIPHPLVLRPHIEVHRKYWVSYTNGNIIYYIKLYWKWLAFINISCMPIRCVKLLVYFDSYLKTINLNSWLFFPEIKSFISPISWSMWHYFSMRKISPVLFIFLRLKNVLYII